MVVVAKRTGECDACTLSPPRVHYSFSPSNVITVEIIIIIIITIIITIIIIIVIIYNR